MPKNETNHVEATGRGPFDSLELLCQSGEIPDGRRPYKLMSRQTGKLLGFAVDVSPKSAAATAVEAKRVTDKELNDVLLKMQAKAFRERLEAEELAGEEQ